MLFVVTGSAGSGKSAALHEIASRRQDLTVIDTDKWGPPPECPPSWWQDRFEVCVQDVGSEEARGRDAVLGGWITLDDVLRTPSARALEGIAVCLLDCADSIRVQRIEERAASGIWGTHRQEQIAHFLHAAAEMRATEDETVTLDTSDLSVAEVADWIEGWIAEQQGHLHSRRRQA